MTKDERRQRNKQTAWERQDRIYQRVKDKVLDLYLNAPKGKPLPRSHEQILTDLKAILGSEDYDKLDSYNRARIMGVHEAMHEWLMREAVVYTHVLDGRRVERDDPALEGRVRDLDTTRSCYCYKYVPLNEDQRLLDA